MKIKANITCNIIHPFEQGLALEDAILCSKFYGTHAMR